MTLFKNILFFPFLLAGAWFLGAFVSFSPTRFSVYLLAGIAIVLISFWRLNYALGFLILAMLLSPEIPIAQVPGRAVVVRFDTFMVFLIFFVWFIRMAIDKTLPLIKNSPLNKYILYYLAVCFLFTGKGIIMGDVNFTRAIFYLIKFTEYFLIFWMAYNIITEKKDIKILMTFATITAIAVIIYGYTQLGGRITAPFDDEPSAIGGYLILVLSVSLGVLIYHPLKSIKLLAASIFFLTLPILAGTESRASYLAFIPMYMVVALLTRKYQKTLIMIGILFIFLLPVLLPGEIYGRFKERVQYTFSGTYGAFDLDPSSAARLTTWKYIMRRRWPQRPFFGWGITGVPFIDSQYVRVMVELGVVGMAVFLLLLYKIFTESLKIFKNLKMGNGIVLGFMAGFSGLLLHAMTANTFIIVRIMGPFWCLTAIVMSLPRIDASEKNEFSSKNSQKYAL